MTLAAAAPLRLGGTRTMPSCWVALERSSNCVSVSFMWDPPWLGTAEAPSPPQPRSGEAAGGVGSQGHEAWATRTLALSSAAKSSPLSIIFLLVLADVDHKKIARRFLTIHVAFPVLLSGR